MRFLCLAVILAFLPLCGIGQSQFIAEFYDQYKNQEQATHIDVQGWLLKLSLKEDASDNAEQLLDKITKLRILTMDNGNPVSPAAYQKLLRNLQQNDFEELFRLREGQENVGLYIREKDKKITNVLLAVHGQDNFILLSLEGLLRFSDLNDLHLDIEGMEHFEQLPDNKADIPRA